MGNDTYIVESVGDVVTENAEEGVDLVQSSVTYTLAANVENLTLTGAVAINGTGNAGDNTLIGNGLANVLNGGAGSDSMAGGAGNDTYVVDSLGDVVIENAAEGTDLVQSSISYTLADNVENLTLTGTGALNGTGNVLNNTLTGNTADNILDGGMGADALIGGTGNDTYLVDNVGDLITEGASAGTDSVIASVTHTLAANVENLTLTGSGAIGGTGNTLNNTLVGNAGDNLLNGGAGNDAMVGGVGNDTYIVESVGDVVTENAEEGVDLVQSSVTHTLAANVENLTLTGAVAINGTGNAGDNTLIGNGLANVLNGGAGDDVLNGGAGADNLIGGQGNDTYVVDATTDVVTENAGEGIDLVQSSVTYTLAANVENLTLTGAVAINGTGNAGDNTLIGNGLANVLNGGAGSDSMAGGAGNDTYVVDSLGDVVIENAAEGTDLVQSSISYTLADNVENLTLTGTGALNGTGNVLNNTLTGNTADNILDGGMGADALIGGTGNDTYLVDNVGDLITEGASAGTDSVIASVTHTLAANVENLTLTGSGAIGGTGNTLNNTLVGNAGDNLLNGGAGNDAMVGGVGNDTYIVESVGDVVTENAEEGVDLVQSSVTYTLAANVENLTLTGAVAINGTGNAGDNTLIGNGLANVLNGGAGSDSMAGGAGNDTYVVDSLGDVVIENAAEGTDLVQSSISYTLADNVENLTLTGTGALNGTGNVLNNTLTGNTADNILDGGMGADALIGGTGNDTYLVDNAGDLITEGASAGTDSVIASVTHTLAANVENLTLTGSGAIGGTGNTLNNTLVGNAGDNLLNGGAGNDAMVGGVGNDTYIVESVGDVVTENAEEGVDLVQSSVTHILAANVENLTLTGTTAINGTGNTENNTLIGNSAINILNGSAGNDTLDGLGGADTLIGGAGDDVFVVDVATDVVQEAVGEGFDAVRANLSLSLAANVEALFLGGTAALNGTGNTLANLLRGNTGINTLNGGAGTDILEGGDGNDLLTDTVGSALFNGGAGADTLTGGAAAEVFLGGSGNDTLVTAGGNDVLLFNKGDGQDVVAAGGSGSDTLSVGGAGLAYGDLAFARAANDLVLKLGATDQVTFRDWYAATPSRPVVNLQVIAEAMAGFSQGGPDALLDQRVERFNFGGLVGAFDAARVANPTLTTWALSNALAVNALGGSDSAALGGDLAYQYGRNGTLAGIGATPALAALADANLGTGAQALNPLAALQTGSVRLG
ncbi:MAG: hypothetical protein IPM73_13020 [Betaproteobacteria bacterium]|nr:hypothetical protein [Betaproteobacteria bacterium]